MDKVSNFHEEKMLGFYFRDTLMILVILFVSCLSIGFAMEIKSQRSRSEGNKVKVEYMKKHLSLINVYNFIWILFLANSYFMLNYHQEKLDSIDS
jgi:hypothetical protein